MNSENKVLTERAKAKRKKLIKRIILIAILLVLLVTGLRIYRFYMANGHWPWEPAPVTNLPQTRTMTIEESTYTTSIDVSGSVEAFDTQKVQIRSTGAITGIYAKEGDRVTKGQVLATVDDSDQQYNVANIEKQLQSAKLSGTSSQKDIDLLEMQLKSAKKKVDNTIATANFDGVVVSVDISEGDYNEAGAAVMTIIDDSKLKATVEVDEIDIQMVQVGQKISITSDSSPGAVIEGRVSYIPMIGRYSNQGIGVMDVEIIIDDPPKTLKPGFSFEGSIEIENQQSMIIIPQAAVTTQRNVSYVTKVNSDGTKDTVAVQVKYLGEGSYQVLSGLSVGDTIEYSTSNLSGFGAMMSDFGIVIGGADGPAF